MSLPIAVQLYSVRELLTGYFAAVVGQIAEMGYLGVEPFGLNVEKARMQARVFADLGLAVPSMHGDLPLGDNRDNVLDMMETLGTTRVYASRGPDQFQTVDAIKKVCDDLNAASVIAAEHGLKVGYHNHWWEFATVMGTNKTGYAIMLEHLDPAVEVQVDTYWVQTGGADPVKIVQEVGQRAPTLHIKDGPATTEAAMVAIGDGVMDFPAIIAAGAGATEWLIVELDRCDTDMLEAVRASYDYLTGEGLARGRE